MAQELTGQQTPEQIEALKAANPEGIFFVKKAGRIAYFREPELMDLNAAAKITRENPDSPMDYYFIIAADTYVAGCRELFEGGEKLKRDFMATFQPYVDGQKGELGNL